MSFEGDIDWEELAIKLIRENKTLKRKIEELEKKDDVIDWSDRMAPEDSGLPYIITRCTPAERAQLFLRAQKKIKDGTWIASKLGGGSKGGKARPAIGFEPQAMRDKEARGELPRVETADKRRPGKFQRQQRNVTFPLTHILLVGAGLYPKPQDVASHVCHNSQCCDVTHFVWESQGANIKREKCRKAKQCSCKEQKQCRFDCEEK